MSQHSLLGCTLPPATALSPCFCLGCCFLKDHRSWQASFPHFPVSAGCPQAVPVRDPHGVQVTGSSHHVHLHLCAFVAEFSAGTPLCSPQLPLFPGYPFSLPMAGISPCGTQPGIPAASSVLHLYHHLVCAMPCTALLAVAEVALLASMLPSLPLCSLFCMHQLV